MGWVKAPVRTSEDIFCEIVKRRPTWNGRVRDGSSPYEYWNDYLRDMYDLTPSQADKICRRLKEYYGIRHFYYGE